MFDEDTRAASQANLEGFGTTFAGRGESINTAIGAFRPLLRDVIPVMQNLSAPETGLGTLVTELSDAAAIVAPAAETQASLFRNLDATMAALREVARPYIQDSIEGGKPALDAGIESLPRQRPFLANSEGLMRELQPGAEALKTAAPELSAALADGIEVLPRTPPFNRRLDSLLQEVKAFADDPLVPRGIQNTTALVDSLRPTLDYLAPTQTVCNYLTLWFRNISSLLSEGDRNGTWQRFIIVATPQGPNNEGGPSSGPANGPLTNYLHTNPYPNTAAPGQPRECEAGNEQLPARPDGHLQRPGHPAGPHRGLRRGGRRVMARRGRRSAPSVERLHRAHRRGPGRRRDVLRLHQGHPVHERLPGPGAVRVGELDPAQLAGPDRRRGGRQGQGRRGHGGLKRRRAGAGARRRRAAAARGRDGQDPPAHLPRGQLLRRPQARHAGRARSSTRATRSRSRRRPRRCSSTRS